MRHYYYLPDVAMTTEWGVLPPHPIRMGVYRSDASCRDSLTSFAIRKEYPSRKKKNKKTLVLYVRSVQMATTVKTVKKKKEQILGGTFLWVYGCIDGFAAPVSGQHLIASRILKLHFGFFHQSCNKISSFSNSPTIMKLSTFAKIAHNQKWRHSRSNSKEFKHLVEEINWYGFLAKRSRN